MSLALGLFIALAALQAVDAATTLTVLARGGREANPAMRWLMRKLGLLPALVAAKMVLVGLGCGRWASPLPCRCWRCRWRSMPASRSTICWS